MQSHLILLLYHEERLHVALAMLCSLCCFCSYSKCDGDLESEWIHSLSNRSKICVGVEVGRIDSFRGAGCCNSPK